MVQQETFILEFLAAFQGCSTNGHELRKLLVGATVSSAMNLVVRQLKKLAAVFSFSQTLDRPARFRVVNLTRNSIIATDVTIATTGAQRSKGLLGRYGLAPGEGLWIAPCESVHTFGMRFAIDLIYLDKQRRIRKIRRAVPPWRISACVTAYSVLEMAAGAVRESDAQPGDTVEFVPADPSSAN